MKGEPECIRSNLVALAQTLLGREDHSILKSAMNNHFVLVKLVSCNRITCASCSFARYCRTVILLAVRPSIFCWRMVGLRNILMMRLKRVCRELITQFWKGHLRVTFPNEKRKERTSSLWQISFRLDIQIRNSTTRLFVVRTNEKVFVFRTINLSSGHPALRYCVLFITYMVKLFHWYLWSC